MSEEIKIPVDQVHAFDEVGRASVRIAELQQQLDAANQRIAGLKQTIDNLHQYMDKQNGDYLDLYADKKAAERKLTAVRDQVQFVKNWFLQLEDGLPESDPLIAIRRHYHAPVHAALDEALAQIEQPQGTTAEPIK